MDKAKYQLIENDVGVVTNYYRLKYECETLDCLMNFIRKNDIKDTVEGKTSTTYTVYNSRTQEKMTLTELEELMSS